MCINACSSRSRDLLKIWIRTTSSTARNSENQRRRLSCATFADIYILAHIWQVKLIPSWNLFHDRLNPCQVSIWLTHPGFRIAILLPFFSPSPSLFWFHFSGSSSRAGCQVDAAIRNLKGSKNVSVNNFTLKNSFNQKLWYVFTLITLHWLCNSLDGERRPSAAIRLCE